MTHESHKAAAEPVLERLRATFREQHTADALLDFAQLMIEPARDEDAALKAIELVLVLEPENARALLLHAYVLLHYVMLDEELVTAELDLMKLMTRGEYVGAAGVLLHEARGRLVPDDRSDENFQLLLRSVAAEPDWTVNRLRLARALRARGEEERALLHFDAAITNLREESENDEPIATSFEDCFTGRHWSRRSLIQARDGDGGA